jgi:hypothetical protein
MKIECLDLGSPVNRACTRQNKAGWIARKAQKLDVSKSLVCINIARHRRTLDVSASETELVPGAHQSSSVVEPFLRRVCQSDLQVSSLGGDRSRIVPNKQDTQAYQYIRSGD